MKAIVKGGINLFKRSKKPVSLWLDTEVRARLRSKRMSISDQFIVRSWRRKIDETDDEVDDTEFDIGSTRVRADDAQSENGGVASEIGDGEGNEQSHHRPAASSAHHSDFTSTLFKSTDLVKPQAVARVGGNGEWGIHGIIGKEVIEGRAYYCVDWEPTMMPLDELCGAERLVREFEAKEQARLRKAGNTRKKKHRGRPRKKM